jgi:hypothetical protein
MSTPHLPLACRALTQPFTSCSTISVPLGSAYVETDEAEADENTIVSNIIDGEYSNPVRVVSFNTQEGWSRDVTEDIARIELNRQGRSLTSLAREFVGRVTGESLTVVV